MNWGSMLRYKSLSPWFIPRVKLEFLWVNNRSELYMKGKSLGISTPGYLLNILSFSIWLSLLLRQTGWWRSKLGDVSIVCVHSNEPQSCLAWFLGLDVSWYWEFKLRDISCGVLFLLAVQKQDKLFKLNVDKTTYSMSYFAINHIFDWPF